MSSPIENLPLPAPPAAAGEGLPLRTVLVASHAGLAAVVVLGFGLTLFVASYRAIHRQAEADLLATARTLAGRIAEGADPAGLTIPDFDLHRFGRAPRDRAYWAVWDAGGRRVAESGPLPPHAVPAETPPPLSGKKPFVARPHGRHLDVIVAAPGGGQLLVGRPLAKEGDAIGRLAARLLVTGLAGIAAGGAAAWWLAGRLSRPIVRMADAVREIDGRLLGRRLAVGPAPREVTALAAAFDAMLAALQAAFERQARFTADASHELRTPVAVVLAEAEHALARERSPDAYRDALRSCRNAALRARSLTDDLLVLARADAGRLDLRRAPLDLADVAAGVLDLLRPLAAESGVRFDAALSPTPLSGDASRLAQVVTNLASNAIRYGASGGEVAVEVRTDGDGATLVVRDRGPGIPPSDRERVFDRFHRTDIARTEGGTGLGLSIVAEIVAAHGGTVALDSAVGTGTTVTIRLPADGMPASILPPATAGHLDRTRRSGGADPNR